MARFSLSSLLRKRRHRPGRAAATPAAPVTSGTVVSSQGVHATIRGLPVAVGDVVAISGWEAVQGAAGRPSLKPGVEAEVVSVDRAEATVMPLAAGWIPTVGARVVLSHRGGQAPAGRGAIGQVVDAPGRPAPGTWPFSSTRPVPVQAVSNAPTAPG